MSDPTLPEDPMPEEILAYCYRYEQHIFVRACVDGKWSGHSLASLDPETRAVHVMRFIDQGVFPVRVKTLEEAESDGPEV